MTKALTIRTDEDTLEKLERIARAQDRSRNYVANLAIKTYLKSSERTELTGSGFVFEDPADYRSRYWTEDDGEAFEAFLAEERAQSLKDDEARFTP